MSRRKSKELTPETRLNWLLSDLCGQLGFCNNLSAKDLLAKNGRVDADEFASAVLTAEGMVPEYEKNGPGA